MTGLRARLGGRGPSVRKVGTVLGMALLIALVVPFAVFAVPQVIGADHGYVILSGSMEPDIAPGDVVIVDASASVGVGDVVTFKEDSDIPVTHRIVAREDGQWVTKGDANENRDARPVAPENVLGRVVLVIPLMGHVVLWVNTPVGYVSLVLLPLVLLLGNELLSWARDGEGDDGDGDTDADGDDVPAAAAWPSAADTTDGTAAETDGDTETTMTQQSRENAPQRSTAPASPEEADEPASVSIAVTDLKLSVLASLGLFAYAAWNVYAEVTTVGAPDPISVGALTAGLLGLVFTSWVTAHAWYTARAARQAAAAETEVAWADWTTPETETDGGVEHDADATEGSR